MAYVPAPIEDELARQLWDAAPAIVLILDQEGRVLRVNRHFQELTGFDLSDVVGRDWATEFLPERAREHARELFARALGAEEIAGAIGPLLTRSGGERVIEWHYRVLEARGLHAAAVFALGFDVTERFAAEAALRRSQEQLNEAQRLAKLGSWHLDLRTDELEWSDEIFRIFEIDPTRFGASYEAFLEAVHPDDRELVNRAYTASVEARTPYDIVHRVRLPSGLTKWVHERCETRYDAKGHPVVSNGTVQDITEQMLAQRTLKESQKAYRRLHETARLKEGAVDATPNAIAFWSFEGTLTYVNSAFVRMWGFTDADDALGRSIVDLSPDLEKAEALVTSTARGELLPARLPARRRNGEEFAVLAASCVLHDDEGQPAQVMGIFAEVTDQVRLEETLRSARDLLRRVVDAAPDRICVKDASGRFLFVNRAFAEARGRTPAELVGRMDTVLGSRDDERVLRGETVHVALDRVALQGGARVCDMWKVPLRDEVGAVVGVASFWRDASERGEARPGEAHPPA